MFSGALLQKIKGRLVLSEVIGKYIPTKRHGPEYQALCPFHKEKTPSFTINDQKGFYHCFGCGAHGSVIDFIMELENLDFPAAVKFSANLANITLPPEGFKDNTYTIQIQRESTLTSILKLSLNWFQKSLATGSSSLAENFIRQRHLSEEALHTFKIGFSPLDTSELIKNLEKEAFKKEDILACGLFSERSYNKGFTCKLRNRIIFPIFNRKGDPIAFGGRLLEGDGPKYLNTPETDLFKKRETLYNEHIACKVRDKEMPLLVVEGYMDVIRLSSENYPKAVAPLGTSLTEEHILNIWRIDPSPILCFDGDQAGAKASIRSIERALPFLKPGYTLTFLTMPKGQDPDSYIQTKGLEEFRRLFTKKETLFNKLWSHEVDAINNSFTPENLAKLENNMYVHGEKIKDQRVKKYFKDAIKNALYACTRSFSLKRSSTKTPPRILLDQLLREKILFYYLVHMENLFDSYEERLFTLELQDPSLTEIWEKSLYYLSHRGSIEKTSLRTYLLEEGFESDLEKINNSVKLHVPTVTEDNLTQATLHIKELLHSLESSETEKDLKEAKLDMLDKFDSQSWQRYKELKKELLKGRKDEHSSI